MQFVNEYRRNFSRFLKLSFLKWKNNSYHTTPSSPLPLPATFALLTLCPPIIALLFLTSASPQIPPTKIPTLTRSYFWPPPPMFHTIFLQFFLNTVHGTLQFLARATSQIKYLHINIQTYPPLIFFGNRNRPQMPFFGVF